MIRCKAQCYEVTKRTNSDGFVYDAKFNAVYGTSSENKEFFAATPTLNISVCTLRADNFTPGKEYYVDFTEA